MNKLEPVKLENDKLVILDQTLLPGEERYITIDTAEETADAIRKLQVRGAPAIGVAAAIGLYAAMRISGASSFADLIKEYEEACEEVRKARPTAVNLSWACERMTCAVSASGRVAGSDAEKIAAVLSAMKKEAEAIRDEDISACRAMGILGLSLLRPGMTLLTHCNAGALATAGTGTCLAPVYEGIDRGMSFRVYADETRPLLQGARLTAWELKRAGVDVTLICDNMASTLMKKGEIDAVVVGCDRMAANGDGANKIGTSGLAVLAGYYGVPFYMFAPTSTIDLSTETGGEIEVEEREGSEISELWYETPMAPEGVNVFNPAFDITDGSLITAVVTEKGIVYPPYKENLIKIK